ncbi:MAG: acyltransferase family protein [Albidovulum sp.]
MPSDESRLIETLRVFCIIAMMWVHVSPGIVSPSAVTTGDFALVGTVLGNTLGRVSVALLSFVSGYLIWHRARAIPLPRYAAIRFRSLLVPMLVWSALFILLAVMKAPLTGATAHRIDRIDIDTQSLANAWAGITGPTANLSLFFLRDLFVGSLLLRAALPIVTRAPVAVAATALLVAPDRVLEPLVFRAPILQFLVFGAVAARLGYSLTGLARPMVALPIGYLLVSTGVLSFSHPGNPLLQGLQLPSLSIRAGVCFLLLALTQSLMSAVRGLKLYRVGRHAYLAYLMHVPLFGVLWVIWRALFGDASDPSYVLFFLGSPFAAFAAAIAFGLALDRAPEVLQIALRGRIVRPARSNPAD